MSGEDRIEEAATDRRGDKSSRPRWVRMPGGERRFSDLPATEIAKLLRQRSKLGELEANQRKAEASG